MEEGRKERREAKRLWRGRDFYTEQKTTNKGVDGREGDAKPGKFGIGSGEGGKRKSQEV